jgi:hypothetical protein
LDRQSADIRHPGHYADFVNSHCVVAFSMLAGRQGRFLLVAEQGYSFFHRR